MKNDKFKATVWASGLQTQEPTEGHCTVPSSHFPQDGGKTMSTQVNSITQAHSYTLLACRLVPWSAAMLGRISWQCTRHFVSPQMVVLAEAFSAGKANLYPESVSILIKREHCPFHDAIGPMKSMSPGSWLIPLGNGALWAVQCWSPPQADGTLHSSCSQIRHGERKSVLLSPDITSIPGMWPLFPWPF